MIWDQRRARPGRSRRPHGRLVTLLFLGVFALIALEGWLVMRSIAETRSPQEENPVWITTNLEIERLGLQLALAGSLLSDRDHDAAMARLADAVDIYYGRVQTVAAVVNDLGPLPMPDRAKDLVGRLEAESAALAEDFDSGLLADDRARRRTLDALRAAEGQVHELATLALMHTVSVGAADRAHRENQFWVLVALAGPRIMLLLGVIVFYRRLAWVARRRQEQYHAAGLLLHRILEAVPEAVIITHEDGRIQQMNRTAERMFGIDRNRAPGQPVPDFLPEATRHFLAEAGRNDLLEPDRIRARLVRADGTRFLAEIGSVIEHDGRGQRLRIYFVQDLTELLIQRARDRRDRRMDLLEARRKSSVFAAMTHDLRTPLQIVSGALATITGEELSAEDREHLDLARHASIHAVARVEDAIASAQRDTLSPGAAQAFDPAGLARSILGASRAAGGTGARTLLAAGVQPVSGNPRLCAVALARMVDWAAASFSSLERVTIRIGPAGTSMLRIAVGAGGPVAAEMPAPEEAMRSAVEAMGTDLVLHGHRSAGELSASFVLPLARPSPAPEDEPPASLRVLVVDDAPAITMLIARMIERLGHAAEECRSGSQAVSRAAATVFDVVLLDVSMPGMDGLEVARQIRAGGLSAEARLILLSANLLPEERPRARLLGVEQILMKPASLEELDRALSHPPDAEAEDRYTQQDAVAILTEALGRDGVKGLLRELRHELAAVAVGEAGEGGGEETARLVHRCAGSAAILGLTDLHAACCAYELALRREGGSPPDELPRSRARFAKARDRALARLPDLGRAIAG